MSASPPLKWAGGKRQLAPTLLSLFPAKVERYYEPFFGGGAVYWAMQAAGRFQAASLSDALPDLVDTYVTIRDDVEGLITELSRPLYANDKRSFELLRAADTSALPRVGRAARMIYLNRTAFNGLYRVNRRGQFNVPFGGYKNPTICDAEGLRACSRALSGKPFAQRDFVEAVSSARPGDLVYLDPPYVPASLTASFTAYAAGGFGKADHERCAALFRALAGRGVSVVLSNSDTPLVRELFCGFPLRQVQVWRSVGASAETRKMAGEVIVLGGPVAGQAWTGETTPSGPPEAGKAA